MTFEKSVKYEEIDVEESAEGYVELFSRVGVDYVFGSPGSEFIPVWEYLAKYNSQGRRPYYINSRHEGLSLSLAKGYTMATGKPQVVLAHVLTGLLHGAMELKAMYTDNIPVVLIIGQNRTHEKEIYGGTPGPHYLSFTEVGGQQRLVDAYVKWSDAPDSNANVLSIFSRAFEITSSDVKGPVLISISRELLFEKVKKMRIPPSSSPTPIQADPRALEKLSELLVKSKLPIIYTRYLGRSLTAVESLVELTDILAAPVFETPGYMNFPTNHPMHLGYSIYPYASEADLILVIDASGWPPWYPPSSILRRSNAKIVFIDLDPLQIKYSIYNYPSHMLIKADSSLALSSLVKLVKEKLSNTKIADEIESRRKTFSLKHREIREEWRREVLKVEGDTPIDARWLCHCINEAIDENTLIVHETISYGEPIHRLVEKNRIIPGTWFEAAGPVAHTGLGQGLGVAMGLKLARPDKTVIALEGDGALNYNPVTASYGLAQEYSLPFLTVIFNNQSYASMKNHLKFYPEGWSARTGTFYGVYFKAKPNYAKIAEAFDGYSEVVENPQDVKPALTRGLDEVKGGRFALLDIVLKQP